MELTDILVFVAITGGAGFYLWRRFFKGGGCGCGSGCSSCGDSNSCSDEREKMTDVYGIKEKEEIPVVNGVDISQQREQVEHVGE